MHYQIQFVALPPMNNNDILRRLRFAFDYDDDATMRLFALGGLPASRAQISDWLKPDEHPEMRSLPDPALASFLNGWIVHRRGPSEQGVPEPERRLNNNLILRKLKIGLALRDDQVLELLASVGFPLSRHELSAFFRRPDHPLYRVCHDQLLRNVLKALQFRFRPDTRHDG